MSRSRALGIGIVVCLLASGAVVARWWQGRDAEIVVGVPPAPTTTAAPGPTIVIAPQERDPRPPEPTGGAGAVLGGRVGGLAQPDGGPYGTVLPFHSDVAVPDDLRFVLVAGADARPGEDVRRARADSIHVVAVNPGVRAGTLLGIPRDAYVTVPGHGRRKVNEALALGGPDLLARTVHELTGLPIHYYVLTGFAGFERIVDELGGVHVYVERRMADRASGAHFEAGWHHFTGSEALAFSRNRKDAPEGDFSRSENHGRLVLATKKMRAEVADMGSLRGWLDVLVRHSRLDLSWGELESLAVLGRQVDPARVVNVVAPGRVGTAGRASVVYLTEEAARLFEDLRDDAMVGDAAPPTTSTSAPPGPAGTATTSTTSTVPTSTTVTLAPDDGLS